MAYNAVNNSNFTSGEVGVGSDIAQLNDNIEDTRSRVSQNETDIQTLNSTGFRNGNLGLYVTFNPADTSATVTEKLNIDGLGFTATATDTAGLIEIDITIDDDIGAGSIAFAPATELPGDFFDFAAGGTSISFSYRHTTGTAPNFAVNLNIFYDRNNLN